MLSVVLSGMLKSEKLGEISRKNVALFGESSQRVASQKLPLREKSCAYEAIAPVRSVLEPMGGGYPFLWRCAARARK